LKHFCAKSNRFAPKSNRFAQKVIGYHEMKVNIKLNGRKSPTKITFYDFETSETL
jgi:hypothetical protein